MLDAVRYFSTTVIVAAIALGVAASVGGIAQAFAIRKAIEGMARQPEVSPRIQLTLIIGLAFIESLVLYVLFIGIILLFANPFVKYIVK